MTHAHTGKFKKWSGLNEARETRRDELNEGEKRSFPLHHILICCDCIHSRVRPGPDGARTHKQRHTHTNISVRAHTEVSQESIQKYSKCAKPLRAPHYFATNSKLVGKKGGWKE